MIFSSINGDEIFNSQLKGLNLNLNYTLFDYILSETVFWLLQGDISPFSTFKQAIFYTYVNDPLVIKIFYFFLLFSTVFTFYYFLKINLKNKYLPLSFFLIISIFFQYQLWHDVFLIFPLFVMPHFILILISLVFFSIYLKKDQRYCKTLAIFFLFLSFGFTTISTVPFIPIYILLSYYYRGRIKIKDLTSIFILSLIFIFVVVYFKFFFSNQSFFYDFLQNISNRGHNYDGRILKIELFSNFYAFVIQTFGALPLSALFRKENFVFSLYDFIFIFPFFITINFLLKQIRQISKKESNFLLYLSIILIFSASPVCLSEKYVEQLIEKNFGYSYIYVFFQYFGFSLLFLLIYKKLKINSHIFCTFLTVLSLITLSSNRLVVETNSLQKNYDIDLVYQGSKNNIFDDIEEYSNIYFETSLLSNINTPQFLSTHINKNVFSNYYSIRLSDYSLINNSIELKKSNFINNYYLLNNLRVKNIKNNRYVLEPKKTNNAFNAFNLSPRMFKSDILSFNKSEKEKIIENSNKLYYLKTIITKKDKYLVLLKIKEIIIINDKISDLVVSSSKVYSLKKNSTKIIKTENSFKEIINSIDNSENHINFVYNIVKPKFKKPDSFYNGMLSCNLNKINLKKNSFLNLITINSLQQEENLSISIDNNSKSDWNINDFTLKNPVTIRSIIFDKNNNSFPGPSLTDFYFYVKKGQSTSFNVNYLKFNEMVKQIKKVKEAKYLMIDLVHEGKIYFHQKKFLPCKINIT